MNQLQQQAEISQETSSLIEEHIRHLLEVMGFAVTAVTCRYQDDVRGQKKLHIAIEAGDEGRLLIGVRGNHLMALQHIIRSIMRRHVTGMVRIVVDVNGYLAAREKTLEHIAQEAVRKVGKTGRAVVLQPMSPSERHIVHTILSSKQDIKTESVGDDPNRRIVVKPVFI